MSDTERTTAAPVGASPFVTYSCPEWCERNDHHADLVDADNPPFHYGPRFGDILIGAAGDSQPLAEFLGDASLTDGSPGLRKLSADALAAAEWLEARA